MNKKIVLGFSGGLDTSFCAKYLSEQGYDVHAVYVDTGGNTKEELEEIKNRAKQLGVKHQVVISCLVDYYEKIIKYLIFGNILKNNTYPLSASAERLIQSLYLVEYAEKVQSEAIAHGSTGIGNDQVRFDMIIRVLASTIKIISPIRDLNISREEEINYLKERNIETNYINADYSINKGLWGTVIVGKETRTSHQYLPEFAWTTPVTRLEMQKVAIHFESGKIVGINNKHYEHPVEAITALNDLAQPYGIGRGMHVDDTIIGIKGRLAYEAAAATIIIQSHFYLEKHVLSKKQLIAKETISNYYADWLYDGYILDPVMVDIENYLETSQRNVTGTAYVELHPYYFTILGIESKFDLMNTSVGQYGNTNKELLAEELKGFSKIIGTPAYIYHSLRESLQSKGKI